MINSKLNHSKVRLDEMLGLGSRRPLLVRCAPRALLGLGLLLAQPWAVADLPALYGQAYVGLGQSWEDGAPHIIPPPNIALNAADEHAYLEQVRLLERTAGPYSDGLSEPLSSLGRFYRAQGKYAEALDLFKRALHVFRVNDGLNGESQIPLLRELLDTLRLQGDMQALDELYDYFFSIYSNGYPPYTSLGLQATLEYLRWQRVAVRLELDSDPKKRLIDMYRLNKRILESAGQSPHLASDAYRQLVMSQIRNLYLIQSETDLPRDDSPFQSRSLLHSSRSTDPITRNDLNRSIRSNQELGMNFRQQQLENIQRTSSARGRSLLEALITRTAKSCEAADCAGMHLELGDWQQWNGNRKSANQQYSIVVQILQDAGDTRLLEQCLGRPVELPANGAFWQALKQTEDSKRAVLAAQFDVTDRGDAKNIEITVTQADDKAFRARLRRKLAATRFRPRFVTGQAEAVKGVNRQYELSDD